MSVPVTLGTRKQSEHVTANLQNVSVLSIQLYFPLSRSSCSRFCSTRTSYGPLPVAQRDSCINISVHKIIKYNILSLYYNIFLCYTVARRYL